MHRWPLPPFQDHQQKPQDPFSLMVCSLFQASHLACLQPFADVVLYAWDSTDHLTPTVALVISRITPEDPLRKLSTSFGLKDLLFFSLIAFCAFLYHSINHPIW